MLNATDVGANTNTFPAPMQTYGSSDGGARCVPTAGRLASGVKLKCSNGSGGVGGGGGRSDVGNESTPAPADIDRNASQTRN